MGLFHIYDIHEHNLLWNPRLHARVRAWERSEQVRQCPGLLTNTLGGLAASPILMA